MLDYAVKTMCFDAACTKQLFSGRYYSIVLVTRGTARFHWEAERGYAAPRICFSSSLEKAL